MLREFIELAIRLGGVINTKAVEAGLAAGEARENAPVKLEVKKPLLGPGLALSDLPLAGHLAPQFTCPTVGGDDKIGYAHVLLVEAAGAVPPHLLRALTDAGVASPDRRRCRGRQRLAAASTASRPPSSAPTATCAAPPADDAEFVRLAAATHPSHPRAVRGLRTARISHEAAFSFVVDGRASFGAVRDNGVVDLSKRMTGCDDAPAGA